MFSVCFLGNQWELSLHPQCSVSVWSKKLGNISIWKIGLTGILPKRDGELPWTLCSPYAELAPKAGILENHSHWDFNEEERPSPFAVAILSFRVLHNFASSLSFKIYYFNFSFPKRQFLSISVCPNILFSTNLLQI